MTALLAVVVALLLGSVVLPQQAFALGRGQACVFLAPKGAGGFGHVGWAFQEPPGDHWFFGATEGAGGEEGGPNARKIPPGQRNGAWVDTGNWQRALDTFRNAKANEHPGGYYKQYTCAYAAQSAVHSAALQAQANVGRGYDLFGDNCMNHAYDVLQAYNLTLPSPNDPIYISPSWAPNLWVRKLSRTPGWNGLNSL
ncbi:hypothetical protein OG762_15635 [Streptomyces sp. NBC_01136]|uniref:hypothetical protein n=1 Tax=unclassified Streptomyces TaxID=2593676 RepID=UPI00324C111F|nr:hypothetical protein OG762_15635 [Streptomyces sp. NBC_01136]